MMYEVPGIFILFSGKAKAPEDDDELKELQMWAS
jgi:hypothetical protein